MTDDRNKCVVCTISPQIIKDPRNIVEFQKNGMSIARINGSYGTKEEIRQMIMLLRKYLARGIKILLDLPGNKIRISNLKKPLIFRNGQKIILKPGNFTYDNLFRLIKKGEIFSCSDGTVKMKVIAVTNNEIKLRALTAGKLVNGKGMNLTDIHHGIPFIFERDMELINVAIETKIDLLGLSFVRNPEQVRRIKSQLVDKRIEIVAKVETREAIEKLDDILEFADYIMIDRGDLETEIGRSVLPLAQKEIIARCRKFDKPVIAASQFIPSLMNSDVPSFSEVSDISNAFLDGADYVMLSEETALGKNPLVAINTVSQLRRGVDRYMDKRIKVKILAAGFSSGFGSLTTHKHKCLLDVGGQTIIEHQLENLKKCQIGQENTFLVTGYNSLQLEDYLRSGGHKVNFIYNPWYLTTNMLASLWMSGKPDGAFLILYGDIVFDWHILDDLLKRPDDFCLVVDRKKRFDAEDEKVVIRSDRIIRIGKDIENNLSDAEFIGLAKVSARGAKILHEEMDSIIREGKLMSFLTEAFENLSNKRYALGYLETKGRPWSDNDTLSDLKFTQREVFPSISKLRKEKRKL
ncbi:MAG: pyruvate kinase [Candidatus Omnitrophica bacterium]|nr:pyruvate kinase [Candidatus Omnitrophota bacterium]